MPTTHQRHIVALGWLSRVLGMGVSLLMVRIVLRLLGETQFAVYQVLTAAVAWLSLSSLGLGPALKNLVSESRARGSSDRDFREASGVVIAALFLVGAGLLLILSPMISAGLLRKLNHDTLWAYRSFVAGGLLSLIAALGQVSLEVLYAEFRAKWVYLLSMLASALTLVVLLAIGRVSRPPTEVLFWVVSGTIGPQAVVGLVALRMTGLLTLRFAAPTRIALERIVRLGLRFWVYAVLSNLILMVDYVVISQILAAREIVLYSIMMKIVGVALVLFTTVTAVVWPEWTHHWELREWSAIRRRVLAFALLSVAVCVPATAVAIVALPAVLRVWLHDANVVPSALLTFEFAAYVAVRFWTDAHSAALMAGSRVVRATLFAAVQAVITAPLEYLFGRVWGTEGVIFGLLVGFLATVAWMIPRLFYIETRSPNTPAAATFAQAPL